MANHSVTAVLCLAVMSAAISLSGCASRPHSFEAKNQISIKDMATVAGRWDGTIWKHPKMQYVEGVLLVIKPDGVFNFVGQRLRDFHMGTGELKLRDGRLVMEGSGRHLDFGLYDRDGKAFLAGDARAKSGELYYIELTRTYSAR
jgi:hypothetical protein